MKNDTFWKPPSLSELTKKIEGLQGKVRQLRVTYNYNKLALLNVIQIKVTPLYFAGNFFCLNLNFQENKPKLAKNLEKNIFYTKCIQL